MQKYLKNLNILTLIWYWNLWDRFLFSANFCTIDTLKEIFKVFNMATYSEKMNCILIIKLLQMLRTYLLKEIWVH